MRKKGSKGLAKRFCVPKRRNAHKPQKGKENICQKASIPKSLISEQTPTPRTTKDNSRPDNETTAQDGSQTTFNEFDVEPAPVLDGNLTSGEEGKVLLDIALLPISSRCIPAKCMGDETVPTDGHETFVDESLVIEVVQNEASFKVATEFSDSNATASHPKLISSDMWQQVQRMIQPHLPSYCQTSVENGCFHILVFNKCINKVVLRSIAVKSDGHSEI
ncbi:FMN-dependent NADH-azoreductase [Frankliniella fusca]|uniref:FMN-dependent NADH-azoreductase n=1 Tax=Frankliniella fusca TaxID=407009 RepID=A0AAE1HVW5_9NEOP|nr:FMN-dependent NADH-azoreductase [Frankliniella fusca]